MSKLHVILLGSFLSAIGINFFLIPHKLLDGGMIGAALLFHYMFNLHVGWSTIVLSLPVYLYAWTKQRMYFLNSLYGLVCSSFLIDLIRHVRENHALHVELHPLLCAIIGGGLVGAGTGLMLRNKISTEGSDLLGLFLADLLSVNVGIVLFFIDVLVVMVGAVVLRDEPFLLSIITTLTVGLVTSFFNR